MRQKKVGPSNLVALLSSDFITSSCSVNRVTIVAERKCKALTRELSMFAKLR